MFYIVEIQRHTGLTYGHIVHLAETRDQADSRYCEVLAAAAVSGLPSHSAALIDSDGNVIMNCCYKRDQSGEASV